MIKTNLLDNLLSNIISYIKHIQSTNHSHPIRIYIPHLCDIINEREDRDDVNNSLSKFILKIKHFIRDKNVILIISLNKSIVPDMLINKIIQMSDTVLNIDSFSGKTHSIPYEFKEFCGFLSIVKIQQLGLLAPFRPSGISHDTS